MKSHISILKIAFVAAAMLLSNGNALAQASIQPIALDANDGNRITGFIYQSVGTAKKKDAPLAIMMHGMTGSSLTWLASDNSTFGDVLAKDLIAKGYRVVALDARSHGARKDDMKPLARLELARSGNAKPYLAMINGSLNDYDVLLANVKSQFGQPQHILAMGYSMGAQMAVLFAAKHEEVSHIVTMVPPAAKSVPVVAPINHAQKVQAHWLLITASQDQSSTKADNDALVANAGGKLDRVEFDSGHRLPRSYTAAVIEWVGLIQANNATDKHIGLSPKFLPAASK